MYLLGIDLETTGLDPISSNIIEIGYVMWDTQLSRPINCGSYLIKIDTPLSEEIKTLTGIEDHYLNTFGIDLKQAIESLSQLVQTCEFLVAHNAIEFDRKCLSQACQKHAIEFPKKYWIDTLTDIPYPPSIKTRKLKYLAVEHNISVTLPHRAIFDVLTTLQILSKYDIDEITKRAKTGFVKLIAQVSYADRAKASQKGFIWDPENKIWFKRMRTYDVENTSFDFPVKSETLEQEGIIGC